MVELYVKMVKNGLPIEKVPSKYREKVRDALDACHFVI